MYESGACPELARDEDAATQPCEIGRRILVDSVKVFYRLEEGATRGGARRGRLEGAQSRRDDHDAFRAGPIEDIISNVAAAVDCVDSAVVLVGRQDLAAIGPELSRHYSWSFKFGARARDNRDMWRCRRRRRGREVVNLQDDAVLRRHDHVEAKCALMVERNPGVIRCVDWERRKQRDCNRRTRRDLKDLIALCDENVARGEPGIRRLGRSYSHVFFAAGTTPGDRRQICDVPEAVDLNDFLAAVLGRDHISLRSGHAYGPAVVDNGKGLWIGGWVIGWMTKPRLRRVDSDNGTWIGGVKDSCHRYQPRSCYNDFCSEGDFFHILNSQLRGDRFIHQLNW